MLKLKAKLRRKKKKTQNKEEENNGELFDDGDKGDSSSGLADSRNSSKNSLATGHNNMFNVIDDAIPQFDDDTEDDDVAKPSKPDKTVLSAELLRDDFAKKHADEDRLFRAEFESIPAIVTSLKPKCEYARKAENAPKNRYKNVVTCDDSRVKLDMIGDVLTSDYINASYIDGFNHPKKFIAAQGPKENTVNDFWRMIWEHQCYVIVMITELCELGRRKCEKYWPDDGSAEYGEVLVLSQSTFEFGGFTKRSLKVTHKQHTDESRIVTQFQYHAWPDHGVPKSTSEIFRFRVRTLQSQPADAGPVVVHCSAGVGRTGTYIALDILLGQLDAHAEVDIYDLIIHLRTRRTEMVQSMDQYVLLHKLVMEQHLFGNTDCDADNFNEVHDRLISDGGVNLEAQFDLLSQSYPINRRFGAALLPTNKSKNRDNDAITYDHSKVFIRMRPTEQSLVYYNASNIEGYDVNTKLIAAQGPMESTVEDFWRVVIDNYVTCVVMMTSLKNGDQDQCFKYWPDEGAVGFGEISIRSESTTNHGCFTESKLQVTSEQSSSEITHLRYLEWENENDPSPVVGAAVLKIVEFVAKQLQLLRNNIKPRVLIHCSDGVGRTGVLCAVINMMERLSRENRIDVFRSVKDLRDSRPLMVRSKEQYKLCYAIMRQCLSKRDLDLC